MELHKILALVQLSTMSPIMLLGTVVFFLRRHVHPITGRLPQVVVWLNLVLMLTALLFSLHAYLGEDYISCDLRSWAAYVLQLLVVSISCVRAWILYFRHGIANEKVTEYSIATANGNSTPTSRSRHHRPPQLRLSFDISIVGPGTGPDRMRDKDPELSSKRPVTSPRSMGVPYSPKTHWFRDHAHWASPGITAKLFILYLLISVTPPLVFPSVKDTTVAKCDTNFWFVDCSGVCWVALPFESQTLIGFDKI